MADLCDAPATHEPGGKSRLALMAGTQGTALFGGPNDCYRYTLTYTWASGPPTVVMMMDPLGGPTRARHPASRPARHCHRSVAPVLAAGYN